MEYLLTRFLILVLMAIVTAKIQKDPASEQLIKFKEKTQGPIAVLTTAGGRPIDHKEASNSLNKRLIFNEYFMESLSHFVRERIAERVVHAKGGGAFGYFEVTHDITNICKAKLFSHVGKKTPVAVRFSAVATDRGGIDTAREARGFAIKFYTEEGNWDMVGLNSPVFPIKDPLLFPTFGRALKRNPATGLMDPNMLWELVTLNPESVHAFLYVFGDGGIPYTYRGMPGFSIHTFQLVNKNGESHFVRFHFLPDQGITHLSSEEAMKIAGKDQDFNNRDLYNAIANGNYPTWTACMQVLTVSDVKNAGFDVFDVTKDLPLDKYPCRPFGRLVLNKNPENYFAEMEQIAFCPGNLVRGILGAPDKIFEARRFNYRDAQYYRLGANFLKIPVNCPLHRANTYNRDGNPPVGDNMRDVPNYYPNSFNGPVPCTEKEVDLVEVYQDPPNNFDHSRRLYAKVMSPEERTRLVNNIVDSLSQTADFIQERAVHIFSLIHSELGERVAAGLYRNISRHNYD